ncbi:MAG TPA: prohibitin family protein [Candidatus Gastranaerophilales bacterium]|nr:prohibitin family protein [Candidatus Gastranaerophilales bacterium]
MRDSNVVDFNFQQGKGLPLGIIFIIIVAVIMLSKTIIVVGAGERAVIMNKITGMEKRTLTEGMHFLFPGIQSPTIYSVRTETYTMASGDGQNARKSGDEEELVCLTSDGQKISMDMSVRYNLIPEKVWELHQKVGPNYEQTIIRPEVRSIVRNTIAEFPVIQVYSEKRNELQKQIQATLATNLAKYNINLSEVLVRNVKFTDDFAKAIELKQVALQESERMKYVLEKERQEKERKIIEAEGEAESIRKKGAALKENPRLIQYEYVQKLTPGIKTIISDQKSILNFPAELLKDN